MSRIPQVLDALVSAFQGSTALRDAVVTDGPLVSNSAASDWVCVGYDGDAEGEFIAASVELDWTGDLSPQRGESMDIPVTVIVSRGSTDVRAARETAFAYYDAISELMPALDVPQSRVFVGVNSFRQVQDSNGVHALLMLTVHADTLG